MPRLRILIGLTIAGIAAAQSPGTTGNTAMDQAIKNFGAKRPWGAAPAVVGPRVVELNADPASPCSVRLVEMAIPKESDVKYTMKILEAPSKNLDPMPRAKVPAPPCPKDAAP